MSRACFVSLSYPASVTYRERSTSWCQSKVRSLVVSLLSPSHCLETTEASRMPHLSSSDDEEKHKRSPYPHRKRSQASPLRSESSSSSSSKLAQFGLVLAAIALWRLSDHYGFLPTSTGSAPASETRKLGSLDSTARNEWQAVVDRCEELDLLPGVPDSFYERTQSDGYVPVSASSLSCSAPLLEADPVSR